MIVEKVEQAENGKLAGDVKSKALNLKLRSSQSFNPNQVQSQNYMGNNDLFDIQKDPVKEGLENLRIDMLRELRDLK